MNVLIKRPGENPVEEDVLLNAEFLTEFFNGKEPSATINEFLNVMIHYVDEVAEPNVSIFGLKFYGNVLITGYTKQGAFHVPLSVKHDDLPSVKRFLKSETAQIRNKRDKLGECFTW